MTNAAIYQRREIMEKYKIAVIAGVIAFIIGILIGSGMSENKEKKATKTGVKQLLNEAIQGVERLEKEKRNLKADLERAKNDKMARENKSHKEELEKMRKEKEDMQTLIRTLQGQVAHKNLQLESVEDKSTRIAALEKKNEELIAMLEQIKVITKGKEAETPDKTKTEISQPETVEEKK
jgi:hypothetical protein